MATYATLTVNAEDIIGADYDPSRGSVWIEANTPHSAIVLDGQTVKAGGRSEKFVNGVATFQLVTTNSADNPTSFSYRGFITYVEKGSRNQGGPPSRLPISDFPLTANANLASIEEAWDGLSADPIWRSDFRDEMQALRDETATVAGLDTVEDAVNLLGVTRSDQVAHAPGLGLFFPEAEGAVGNGTTNDSAALTAAYAAAVANGGGTVVLTGTYRQSSTLVLNGSASILTLGYGATLKPDAGVRSIRFNAGSATTSKTHALQGVVIDGSNTGSGIEVLNHYAAVIRDVKVRNVVHGILITDGLEPARGNQPGWSESSMLDNVLVDNAVTGIEFATSTGTGSFGYLNWGKVAIYNVPNNGTGFKVTGANTALYHARIGTLAIQINGDTATGIRIEGKVGRNNDFHILIESSQNSYPTGTIVNRIGIDLTATAVIDGADILAYWQGVFTSRINNPSNVVYQIKDGAANVLAARATGLANQLQGYRVFGDTHDRVGVRADRVVFGSGAANPDSSIVRWGADLIGPDSGDSWRVDATWNGGKLRMGNLRVWVDSAGVWRFKGADPASETDGDIINGGIMAASTSQLNSAAAGVNTAAKFAGKTVLNTTTNTAVTATGTAATATWVAAGVVAHTPV